ncbi:amidase family protein [Nonomuraea glycinis]|uniref:amidase family protein n=1 Tax=Nonomuraea glycinis TaxID=2047744 RepID=UPI002E1034B0|nr:amidase family protein [Nonomuraea glycinis]
MPELHDLSALEQARAIRAREISPVELTQHYLDRIERIDPDVGAFVTVTAASALQQARRLERELPDGPLAGVPIPVKDLNLVRDVPIMFGWATYRDFAAGLAPAAQGSDGAASMLDVMTHHRPGGCRRRWRPPGAVSGANAGRRSGDLPRLCPPWGDDLPAGAGPADRPGNTVGVWTARWRSCSFSSGCRWGCSC